MIGFLSKREKIRLELMKEFIKTKPWEIYFNSDMKPHAAEKAFNEMFYHFVDKAEWIVTEQYKQHKENKE